MRNHAQPPAAATPLAMTSAVELVEINCVFSDLLAVVNVACFVSVECWTRKFPDVATNPVVIVISFAMRIVVRHAMGNVKFSPCVEPLFDFLVPPLNASAFAALSVNRFIKR